MPYTQYLSERFDVLGLDISGGQLAFARKLVPRASFARADMSSLPLRRESFDGIAALYSIIHVPREQHEALFGALRELLRPGRRLLAVLGQQHWEGSESDWLVPGAEMWWSHFDAETNLSLLRKAGFAIVRSNIEPDPLGGAHLFVLAERPG